MKDRKHTHTGNCQLCGRIQAVSKKAGFVDGVIAKHGYTVEGFFNGVCTGSGYSPLQISRTYSDIMIKWMKEEASRWQKHHDQLVSGKTNPSEVEAWKDNGYEREHIPNPRFVSIWDHPRQPKDLVKIVKWEDANKISREKGLKAAIHNAESKTKWLNGTAKDLTALADKVYLTALIPVKPLLEVVVKAGVVFTRWDRRWLVRDVQVRRAQGCGPHLNGKMIEHALVEDLASFKQHWTLVRDVKRCLTKKAKIASC